MIPPNSFATPAPTMTPAAAAVLGGKLKFNTSDRFVRELRKRVDAYFEKTGRRKRDVPAMYFKTATILAWFLSAYLLLLFVASSWWVPGRSLSERWPRASSTNRLCPMRTSAPAGPSSSTATLATGVGRAGALELVAGADGAGVAGADGLAPAGGVAGDDPATAGGVVPGVARCQAWTSRCGPPV